MPDPTIPPAAIEAACRWAVLNHEEARMVITAALPHLIDDEAIERARAVIARGSAFFSDTEEARAVLTAALGVEVPERAPRAEPAS